MEFHPLNIRASNWFPHDISQPTARYQLLGTEDRVIVMIVT